MSALITIVSRAARAWLDWVDRRETARRRASALPKGTRVRLTCTDCTSPHEGIWTITKYDEAANDYRLMRESDREITFAVRNVLEIVPPAAELALTRHPHDWQRLQGSQPPMAQCALCWCVCKESEIP